MPRNSPGITTMKVASHASRNVVLSAFLLSSAAMSLPSAWAAGPPSTAGLHAIIVADTLRGPAGTEVNESKMLKLLEDMRTMGFNVRITHVDARRISPGGILNFIRRLDANRLRNQTLLFYYAGHGGTDAKAGHFMRTPGGDLIRSHLLAEIRAKGPRLAVVLTDCCSTQTKVTAYATPTAPPLDRRAVENLLFQHVGVVDVNASSSWPEQGVYQAAFYHPSTGGLFTDAFTWIFASGEPGQHDVNQDQFLEWRKALEGITEHVKNSFESFRSQVRHGALLVRANANDVRRLMSQASQDPQVFGPLAVRSDRLHGPAGGTPPPGAARRPRFGIYTQDQVDRGGPSVAVTAIERGSPAMRVLVWKNGRKGTTPVPMSVGDTITHANNIRVRNQQELLQVLNKIPEGGELHIKGFDASTGGETIYEATAVLDQYEH